MSSIATRSTLPSTHQCVLYTVVPIFSLLSIGGDNLQFYPNFDLFSTVGGMNLDHDFVQVWKFSDDQKKKSKWNTFFPKFTLRCTPIQIIGGDADVDHSQTIGGIQPNYWGLYPPPCFGTPDCTFTVQVQNFLVLYRQ